MALASLAKKYSTESLNQNSRVLRQYALVVVATKMWLEGLEFTEPPADFEKYCLELYGAFFSFAAFWKAVCEHFLACAQILGNESFSDSLELNT